MPASYEQLQARFRIDTAAVNTAATWGAALNTAWRRAPGSDFRIRFTIQTTGTSGAAAASTENLFVSKNAGAYVAIGGTSGILASATASASADETAISSAQLPVGTGVFVNGVYDSTGATASFTIPRGDYTEVEFGVKIDTANASPGDTFDFRVYRGATPQNTYTATPRITALGVNLASGSYSLNPGGVAGSITFRRPNRTIPANTGAYAFSIANIVTAQLGYVTSLAYAPFNYMGREINLNHVGTGASHSIPLGAGSYAWSIANSVGTSVVSGPVLLPNIGHYAWSIANQVTTSVTGATYIIPLTSGSYALVGRAPGKAVAANYVSNTVSIATVGKDIIISTTPGIYSLVGRPITFAHIAVLDRGTYSVTGFPVTVKRTHLAILAGGAYVLNGTQMSFAKPGHLTFGAGVGTYAVSGPLPVIKSSRTMALGFGSYSVVGRAVTINSNRSLIAANGPYTVVGGALSIVRARYNLGIATVNYNVNGGLMGFKSGPHTLFPAPPGIYNVVGPTTVIKSTRAIQLTPGTYSLTGGAISAVRGHTLNLTVGVYAYGGNQLTFRRTYSPAIATGTYTLTGEPMSFQRIGAHSIALSLGTYSLVGGAATFKIAHTLALSVGSYSLTGLATTLRAGHSIVAGTGFYTLTGGAIAIGRGRVSTVVNGAYVLTGSAMTLAKIANRTISLASGSYSVVGQAIPHLTVGKALASGHYLYIGEPIAFQRAKAPASLASGTYAVTGPAMTMQRGRVIPLNTGTYLTYGSSGTKIFGPGGVQGGLKSAWPVIQLRRRRRA
jgi:hypothetical protein